MWSRVAVYRAAYVNSLETATQLNVLHTVYNVSLCQFGPACQTLDLWGKAWP